MVIVVVNILLIKDNKIKITEHIYTWMIPDDTLLTVAREAETHRAGKRKDKNNIFCVMWVVINCAIMSTDESLHAQ